jgi:parvulin-like peptidyl-prolyl isomerase
MAMPCPFSFESEAMKRLLPCVFLLLTTLCVPLLAQTAPAVPAPLDAAPTDLPNVVATVGHQVVMRSDYLAQLRNYTPNPQHPDAGLSAGRAVLQQMITGLVYIELARQEGVAPTDAEVQTQYDNLKFVQDSANIKTFEERLAAKGLTMQDVKEIHIRPQLAEINLLTKGTPAPTASQIRAYYDQHKADQFTKPDRAHVRGIAVATHAAARHIYDSIQAGKKFDDFLSRSLNTTLPNGEFLQWVPLDASQTPSLAPLIDGIKATAIGQTSRPFQFQDAWWLIQVVDKKTQETVPFDQIKGLIPFALMEQEALPQPTDSPTAMQQKQHKFKDIQQQENDYQKKLAQTGQIQINLPGTQYVDLLNDLKHPAPAP